MSNYRYRAKKGRRRQRRIKKLRKRGAILKNRVFWDVVLSLVFIFSLSYLLFFSRAFEIQEVGIAASGGDVSGLVLGVKEAVWQELNAPFFGFFSKKSFFSISTKAIREKVLKEYPGLEGISVKRVFPHNLFIELFGRKEVGVWCTPEDNCFFIDKKGIIFKEAESASSEPSDGLPLILSQGETPAPVALPQPVISEQKLGQILEVEKALVQELGIPLAHFLTDSQEMLHAVTKQGWKVYFVLGGDVTGALTKLKLLFEKDLQEDKRKNLEYIDLRFSKVYYK